MNSFKNKEWRVVSMTHAGRFLYEKEYSLDRNQFFPTVKEEELPANGQALHHCKLLLKNSKEILYPLSKV